jgi:hypothetical protein
VSNWGAFIDSLGSFFANEKKAEETEDQMQGYILHLSPFLIFFPKLEDIYIDRV